VSPSAVRPATEGITGQNNYIRNYWLAARYNGTGTRGTKYLTRERYHEEEECMVLRIAGKMKRRDGTEIRCEATEMPQTAHSRDWNGSFADISRKKRLYSVRRTALRHKCLQTGRKREE
jgi:hypothetical protein